MTIQSKYLLSLSLLFLTIFMNINAHSQNDSIHLVKKFYKYNYFQQGKKLSNNDVLDIVFDNPAAYDKFKSGSEAYTFANIFTVLGLALIATPIGVTLAGEDAYWPMAWAGSGFIAVSVPLYLKSRKKIPNAINIYNMTPKSLIKEPTAKLEIGSTANGIGLCLVF